jgi:hypothetical protein
MRLRTGREVSVIDVSDAGALVEGNIRLLPGTHVDVHVVTRDGRLLVRSRVSRCSVASLAADAVCYRAALVFDRRVDTAAGYAVPVAAVVDAGAGGPDYPAAQVSSSIPIEEGLST